jgi:hypothetical protein
MGNHAAFVLSIPWGWKLIFHAMLNTRKMIMTEKNEGLLFGECAHRDLVLG